MPLTRADIRYVVIHGGPRMYFQRTVAEFLRDIRNHAKVLESHKDRPHWQKDYAAVVERLERELSAYPADAEWIWAGPKDRGYVTPEHLKIVYEGKTLYDTRDPNPKGQPPMSQLADALTAEITRLESRLSRLRELLSEETGEAAPAAAPTVKRSNGAAGGGMAAKPARGKKPAGKAALVSAGQKAIEHLKKHKGQRVAGPVVAKEIGTVQVSQALKAADPAGEHYKSGGPGRAKWYEFKA